jgi:hypothetical protein
MKPAPRTGSGPRTAASAAWITGKEACQILGSSPSVLVRAALLGYIRVKLEAGEPPRYRRVDVERHAQSPDRIAGRKRRLKTG